MPTEVILPRVDMDMTGGKISRWFVEDGGEVRKGQPLFEMETDKAAMEIDAPADGTLRVVADSLDELIPVGSKIALIYLPGEVPAPTSAQNEVAIPARPKPGASEKSPESNLPPFSHAATHRVRATPLSRRLARTTGLDLASVIGSGPKGRITSADVLALVREGPLGSATKDERRARQALPSAGLNRVWLRSGEGTPLVVLHGFGADLNSWRPLVGATDLGRPVLGIDLPAHGESGYDGESRLEDLVEAVEGTLALEGLSNINLAGHSLGAAVAAVLAARLGGGARSLFLVAPAGLGPEIDGAFLSGFLRARSEASLRPWMLRLVADDANLSPALLGAVLRDRAAGGRLVGQMRLAESLFPDGTQAFSVRLLFPALAIPMKVVFGSEDRIVPARHARGLPGRVGLHVFHGLGHLPHLEARSDVAMLLAETLKAAA